MRKKLGVISLAASIVLVAALGASGAIAAKPTPAPKPTPSSNSQAAKNGNSATNGNSNGNANGGANGNGSGSDGTGALEVGDKVVGKPVDPGKSIDTLNSTPNAKGSDNKPAETGKPADTGKPIDAGKPVDVEGLASFGNPKKLTATEKKAAALAKAEEKADNGNKVNYIVRFNEAADVGNEISALRSAKATVGREFKNVFKGLVVGLTDKQKANLTKRGSVQSIAEDLEVTATDIQFNPAPWGIDRIDQTALPLSASYNYGSTGAGVKIYVVDTGILSGHSEFNGRVEAGHSTVGDTNGTEDCNGHGTHVASTAAGTNYGVAKSATLVPVRVLGCTGSGTTSGVIAGLDWIASQYVAGSPVVVNMSLGGGASSSLDTAVNSLINRGITVVVAAGNSAADACLSSPARVPGAITVAATTKTDSLASYSNYGSCVDLAAPGSSITGAWYTGVNDSAVLSGTSMASPHVAGVAAVLLAGGHQQPNIVSLALTDAATKDLITALPAGTVNSLLYANPAGIGIPVAKAPLAPTSVSAVAGKRSATVSWTPAETLISQNLISQTVRVWANGNVVSSVKVSATATSAVLKLRAGVTYRFTVVATNSVASSVDSPQSNSVVPTNR